MGGREGSSEVPIYDVIIAGASFAGLAVAAQLKGYRVLLLDRKLVGTKQTSACGTILRLMEYWDLTDSVLQTHAGLELHTAFGDMRLPSPYLWCTFDYARFCKMLFERSGAEFVQASVLDVNGDEVKTSRGNFSARYIVDATGWKAALASRQMDKTRAVNKGMNCGVESIIPLPDGTGLDREALHFWYDPAILKRGVGWAFPRGDDVSVGVGAYGHAEKMRPALERMTERLSASSNGTHGTYFPYRLFKPTADRVFVVGDAAGMCLALTGEGIRPAMYFGEACGQFIRRGLDQGLRLEQVLEQYSAFVGSRRFFFTIFTYAQEVLGRLPSSVVGRLAQILGFDRVRTWMFDNYWQLTADWGNGEQRHRNDGCYRVGLMTKESTS